MSFTVRDDVLPLLSKYHTSSSDLPPDEASASKIALQWAEHFAPALLSGQIDTILDLLVPDVPIWRDLITLSWELRTLVGLQPIRDFLAEQLPKISFTKVLPQTHVPVRITNSGPELGWITVFMSFETSKGQGTSVARLVPTRSEANGEIRWKAHGILLDLDELKGHPPQTGANRHPGPTFGGWEETLAKESKFEDCDPTVVIIGGGQSGLAIAARLRAFGVPSLVLERHARLGDSWRSRYDALCLHDPVWIDHMPYIPFPSTWPVYIPARKLANWMESYASILELPVWLSANVHEASRDHVGGGWQVDLEHKGTRKTLRPKHVIFAIGWGAGAPFIPKYPGMEEFAGEFIHSAAHKTAKDHIGKKVVVIGASTSAHDVCADLAKHGVNVTMIQRSPTYVISNASLRRTISLYSEDGPPTEIADRLNASTSPPLSLALSVLGAQVNKTADKELLEGLAKRGFKTYDGLHGTGFLGLLWSRGGGYYFDTGTCGLIIDGSIKIKSDSDISHFTKSGLEFKDGSNLDADVIVWATGYEPAIQGIKRLIKEGDAESLKPVWTMNDEGELGAPWQDSGVKGLYVMMGNLAAGRYYSRHLALRIQAIEEGLLEV